jgi:hypothetical protein
MGEEAAAGAVADAEAAEGAVAGAEAAAGAIVHAEAAEGAVVEAPDAPPSLPPVTGYQAGGDGGGSQKGASSAGASSSSPPVTGASSDGADLILVTERKVQSTRLALLAPADSFRILADAAVEALACKLLPTIFLTFYPHVASLYYIIKV